MLPEYLAISCTKIAPLAEGMPQMEKSVPRTQSPHMALLAPQSSLSQTGVSIEASGRVGKKKRPLVGSALEARMYEVAQSGRSDIQGAIPMMAYLSWCGISALRVTFWGKCWDESCWQGSEALRSGT